MIGDKIQFTPFPEPAEKSGFMVFFFNDKTYHDGFVMYMDWSDPIEDAYDEQLRISLNLNQFSDD